MTKNTSSNNFFRILLPTAVIIAALPFLLYALGQRQLLSGQAAFFSLPCRLTVARVAIHPGTINTWAKAPGIQMSALAYDNHNQPVWKNVTYSWGMSSNNSIGQLTPNPRITNIAQFFARNAGRGNIFVRAYYCSQVASGSVPVVVRPAK